MFKLFILLIVLLSNNLAIARMPSCQESLMIAANGAKMHINDIDLNEQILIKSADIFLDIQDPSKVFLLNDEQSIAVKEFSKIANKTIEKMTKNDCSDFSILEKYIQIGKERWKNILLKNIDLKDFTINKEIERSFGNMKNFSTIQDLNDYGEYYVKHYVKIELLNKKKIATIKKEFKSYIEKEFSTPKKYSLEEIRNETITEALFLSFDPHSGYISEEKSADFEMNMTANLQGVGLSLSEAPIGVKVTKVIKNSPAEKSGKFKKNDIIIKIGNKELKNMNLNDIVDLIRGKKGSSVTFQYIREDENKKAIKLEATLERDSIPLVEQKAQLKDFNIDGKRIVVINLPGFYFDNSSQIGSAYDIINQYNELKKKGEIDSIVLDLRFNGGGILDESIRVAGLFISEGIPVQVKENQELKHYKSMKPPVLITEPLVVLISRASASASEIVAGALKDYGRAVIVGDDRTYGKGTVQSVINSLRVAQLGMVKVTTGKFYTPSGSSTQLKGVSSHLVIPSSTLIQDFGESNQKFALDWSSVESVVPTLKNPLTPYLNILKNNSEKRIKNNSNFNRFKDLMSYRKWSDDQKKKDEDDDDIKINPENDPVLKESLDIAKDLSNLIKSK